MFDQLNMTNAGALLASETFAGDQIEFTKIKLGNGDEPEDYKALYDLVSVKQVLEVARQKVVDINTVAVGGNLIPTAIVENYYWKEIGLYARNVTKGTEEILFSYAYTYTPSFISVGGTITEKYVDVNIQLSDASNVVINLNYSNLFPSKAEMYEELLNLDTKVQEDIRSSKNIWLTDDIMDLPGETITLSSVLFANINTKSTGEQAVLCVGDTVITSEGHVGFISNIETNNITVTTIHNSVSRKKQYTNGDWEMYMTSNEGGGHYYWDYISKSMVYEGFADTTLPHIVYKDYTGNTGGDGFQTVGGTDLGARILTAWSGKSPNMGQIRKYYTTNTTSDDYSDDDEIANHTWVKTYVADNTGIYVGTAASYGALIAGNITGTPSGHTITVNDWAIVEDDENKNGARTSYIVSATSPLTWTFATIRAEDIPAVDNSTIYLDSNGQYAVKPGATLTLSDNSITDANIGNRVVSSSGESTTILTSGDLTTLLNGLTQNVRYLMNRTVKAPDQTIHMYVQDTAVTPETGINKVRIPITENQ